MVLVSGGRAQRDLNNTVSLSLSESTTSTRSKFQESVVTRSKRKAGKWFQKKKENSGLSLWVSLWVVWWVVLYIYTQLYILYVCVHVCTCTHSGRVGRRWGVDCMGGCVLICTQVTRSTFGIKKPNTCIINCRCALNVHSQQVSAKIMT